MSLILSPSLPAFQALVKEGVRVHTPNRFAYNERPALKIAILNLMPTKTATETQLLRLLGSSLYTIEPTLLYPGTHRSTHDTTPEQHLRSFYQPFEQVRDQYFDGVIITGAPVEQLEFEEVDYWEELQEVLDWEETHAHTAIHICWAAQAALYHRFDIPKYPLPEKMFGVFPHRVLRSTPLLKGYDDIFYAPHSRHTEIRQADLERCPQVEVLSVSEEAGVYMAASHGGRQIYITGHSEYDPLTLQAEYQRDLKKNLPIAVPRNYYPEDDPSRAPLVCWRSHGHLLYSNWLRNYVAPNVETDQPETIGAYHVA